MASLEELSNKVSRLEVRVDTLQQNYHNLDSDIRLMQQDLKYLRTAQDKINSGINKILWTVILSFIGVVTTFAFSGGFSL